MKNSFFNGFGIACAVFASSYAFAGSANVKINCTSNTKSGKIDVIASVPGDNQTSSLVLIVGNAKATYVTQSLIEDFKINHDDFDKSFPGAQVKGFATADYIKLKTYAISVVEFVLSGLDRHKGRII